MSGPAVAEEALLVTIGAGPDDLDLLKAQGFQPVGAIGLQIEAVVAGSIARDEEAGIARLARQEAIVEFLPDLIGGLADRRADGGDDVTAVPAQPLHLVDGRFEHAPDGTLPARMGGADDADGGVGHQHRRTVGGEDGNRHSRVAGDDPVGLRAGASVPRLGRFDDRVAVDLIDRQEIPRLGAERHGHRLAVAAHRCRIVVRAEAAIARGVDTLGIATLAGKEAVTQASDLSESGSLDHCSPKVKGNGGGRSGWPAPRTLNRCPIWSAAASLAAPSAIWARICGGWLRSRAATLAASPMAARKPA